MANSNQTVRTCILKVDLMCCTGCQEKATKKLNRISGVTETEYNPKKGLMSVTGYVEPETLVNKFTKWGKKTVLVSVKYHLDEDDDALSSDHEGEISGAETRSSPDPKTKKNMTWLLRKLSFGLFSKKPDLFAEKIKQKLREANEALTMLTSNGPQIMDRQEAQELLQRLVNHPQGQQMMQLLVPGQTMWPQMMQNQPHGGPMMHPKMMQHQPLGGGMPLQVVHELLQGLVDHPEIMQQLVHGQTMHPQMMQQQVHGPTMPRGGMPAHQKTQPYFRTTQENSDNPYLHYRG